MSTDLAHAGGAAAKFNFAPVSDREGELVYGAERPGTGLKEFDAPDSITPEAVAEWASYMKGQGVQHVLCLLNDKEFGHYQAPGYVGGLVKAGFEEAKITKADMFSPGAADKAAAAFAAAKASGEKLVAHCAGGEGRTGIVLAQYMMSADPSLDAQTAIDKVVGCAAAKGAIRKGAGPKIEKFLKDRTLA